MGLSFLNHRPVTYRPWACHFYTTGQWLIDHGPVSFTPQGSDLKTVGLSFLNHRSWLSNCELITFTHWSCHFHTTGRPLSHCHGWDLSSYSQISGFRFLSESNTNGVETHLECYFSHFQDSNFNSAPPMYCGPHFHAMSQQLSCPGQHHGTHFHMGVHGGLESRFPGKSLILFQIAG